MSTANIPPPPGVSVVPNSSIVPKPGLDSIAVVCAWIVGFIASMLLGFTEPAADNEQKQSTSAKIKGKEIEKSDEYQQPVAEQK